VTYPDGHPYYRAHLEQDSGSNWHGAQRLADRFARAEWAETSVSTNTIV
jgi:hypothetical protein